MARVSGTHEDESMPIGLQKRGNMYWLRRRVPKELVSAYGKAEVVKSLQTKDRAEAKRRLIDELYRLEQDFDRLRIELSTPAVVSDQADTSGPSRLQRLRGHERTPRSLFSVVLDGIDQLDAELAKRGRSHTAQHPRAATNVPLTGPRTSWSRLAEQWAAERKPTAKTRKAHEAVAAEFAAVQAAEGVETSTRADVLAFKAHLITTGISAANLKTKLSRLKTLVNYAHEQDLLTAKIADGVRAPKPKLKARAPFNDDALKRLFEGPVHAEGLRPAQGRADAAYWLPLIALFSGARLEEIAGLLVEDLVELTYPAEGGEARSWFLRLRPDPERNRLLKNEGSERSVPVHPELVRLGLIRYALALLEQGETALFPGLTAHASGRRAHKWGQWFGAYLRDTCGVTDRRIVYHSFRHTLKDAARESAVPEDVQRAIMGHAPSSVADGYGLGLSRRRLVEGMAQIKVLGLPTLQPQY